MFFYCYPEGGLLTARSCPTSNSRIPQHRPHKLTLFILCGSYQDIGPSHLAILMILLRGSVEAGAMIGSVLCDS